MTIEVLHGDMREVLATLPADSFDAVVTDPPYHLQQIGRLGSHMPHWTYSQHTGVMVDPAGVVLEVGYAGANSYVNRPIAEGVENQGPLPTGSYTLEAAVDRDDLGPCAIPLTPHPDNEMHDRSGFYIHGDTAEQNQTASEGCIIMSRPTRDAMNVSAVRTLVVEV